MTRICKGVLATLLVLSFAWSLSAEDIISISPPQKATVTTLDVNLHTAPGEDNPVVGSIKEQGLEVEVSARSGTWFRVTVAGTEAWVSGEFLDFGTAAMAASDEDDAIFDDESDAKPDGEEDGDGILISSIVFEGNTVIASEELSAAVQDYVGQPLSMEEMGELTDLITLVYQEKGYVLARAFLPEQEIADGALKIAIAEGRIGKIKVTGKTHYHERVVKRYFGAQEKLGVVKESALETGLVLSNEIPKLKTDIVLKEGEKAGEVDMLVNVKDSSLVTFGLDAGLDYNNFGSVYTSRNRFGATANIYDHVWGSELKIRGVVGDNIEDSALITGDWQVPVNRYGTYVAANYVTANYLIGEGLEFMGLGGDTEMYGVRVAHPLITKKNKRLELAAGYLHKNVESLISGSKRIDVTNTFNVGFSFDNLDRFLGKNIVFAEYRHGALKPLDEYLWSDPDAAPSYSIVKADVARIQKIYGYTSLLARGSGQYTAERLVSSEQFVIGGYGSVRGWEPATDIGDSGYTLSAELMLAPPFVAEKKAFGLRASQMFQLAAFYDFGQVYRNDPDAGVLDTRTLAGFGAGARIFYKDRFVFKYDIGFPVNKLDGQDGVIHYFLGSLSFF